MRISFFLLLVLTLFGLPACSQTPAASDTSQNLPPAVPTSSPISQPTAVLPTPAPDPTPIPLGGGEYWAASTYREANGRDTAFIIRPLSGAAPEVIFRSEAGYFLHSFRWSPDGQYLVFTDRNESSTRSFYLYNRTNRQIQTIDLLQMTGAPGFVQRIAWSPDPQSGQLAFNLCNSSMMNCQTWLADIFQGKASQINIENEFWSWGPGGKYMIFESREETTRFDIQMMTGEKVAWPTQSQQFGSLAVRLLVFGFFPELGGFLTSQNNGDQTRSYILFSEDGSQERLLFQTNPEWRRDLILLPLLSPDGSRLALNFTDGTDETVIVTGSLDQLPFPIPAEPAPTDDLVLIWSPDSTVYVTRILLSPEGPFSLGFYDAQTGELVHTYQPPPPFDLRLWADSSWGRLGAFQTHSYFDSIWIP